MSKRESHMPIKSYFMFPPGHKRTALLAHRAVRLVPWDQLCQCAVSRRVCVTSKVSREWLSSLCSLPLWQRLGGHVFKWWYQKILEPYQPIAGWISVWEFPLLYPQLHQHGVLSAFKTFLAVWWCEIIVLICILHMIMSDTGRLFKCLSFGFFFCECLFISFTRGGGGVRFPSVL